MATALTRGLLYSNRPLVMKDLGPLPARLALGASQLYHGLAKLKPSLREGNVQFFGQLGFKPIWVTLTGATEVLSGLAAILGIGTRLAALGVLATQAVAIAKVHWTHGFDNTKQGFEYNLALVGIAAGLLMAGPGKVSTHEAVEHLAEGRGARKLLRKARPGLLVRAIKLLK